MTENDSRVYAERLRNIINGEDIILKSEGKQIRSYTYVADCAKAFLYILVNGESKNAYNIANPNSITSIRNMAEVIAKVGDKKVIMELPKEKVAVNPMQCGVLNSDKLSSLGFKAEYDIKTGYSHCVTILRDLSSTSKNAK